MPKSHVDSTHRQSDASIFDVVGGVSQLRLKQLTRCHQGLHTTQAPSVAKAQEKQRDRGRHHRVGLTSFCSLRRQAAEQQSEGNPPKLLPSAKIPCCKPSQDHAHEEDNTNLDASTTLCQLTKILLPMDLGPAPQAAGERNKVSYIQRIRIALAESSINETAARVAVTYQCDDRRVPNASSPNPCSSSGTPTPIQQIQLCLASWDAIRPDLLRQQLFCWGSLFDFHFWSLRPNRGVHRH